MFGNKVKTRDDNNGIPDQWKIKYDNGYGASVICGKNTYGGDEGLYEVAVLKGDEICYTTPITDDVIGRCDDVKVWEILSKIEKL